MSSATNAVRHTELAIADGAVHASLARIRGGHIATGVPALFAALEALRRTLSSEPGAPGSNASTDRSDQRPGRVAGSVRHRLVPAPTQGAVTVSRPHGAGPWIATDP